MRTCPSHVRRGAPRRALTIGLVAALALASAACSDDGDSDSTPTTTSPGTTSGDASATTTEAGGSSTTEGGATTTTEGSDASTTVPGDDAPGLTAEEATAQLQSLLNNYRGAVARARSSGALDERALKDLTGTFTTSRARDELSTLQTQGGVSAINPAPLPLEVADVGVSSTTSVCAAGTVVVPQAAGLFTIPINIQPPFYFRLVPAPDGANAPGWRMDFFAFSNNGVPLEISCT